jgi:hypothetical protein
VAGCGGGFAGGKKPGRREQLGIRREEFSDQVSFSAPHSSLSPSSLRIWCLAPGQKKNCIFFRNFLKKPRFFYESVI